MLGAARTTELEADRSQYEQCRPQARAAIFDWRSGCRLQFPAMLRFYGKLVRVALRVLWEGYNRFLTALTGVAFVLLLIPTARKWGEKIMNWQDISPWWAVAPIGLLFLYGLLRANYERFREIEKERDNLRNKQSSTLEELKGLKEHIDDMAKQVSDDDRNASPDANSSIWTNAGQDLIEARAHGVFDGPQYVALRSILNAADKGLHIWQKDKPLLYGVFCTFISWNERRERPEAGGNRGDRLRYGLVKFGEFLTRRINELEKQLRH